MKAKTKIAIWLYGTKACGYILFLVTVFAFSWLFNRFIEGVFVMVGYTATRFLVPKIKHFKTSQRCLMVSTFTFIFSTTILCLPTTVSIVWNVLIGACIPLVMYAESLLFDPQISDKDRLIELCKKFNYNDLKTQIAIKFFYDKEKPKDVWLWLCETQEEPVEWDTVRHMKYMMKRQLFK